MQGINGGLHGAPMETEEDSNAEENIFIFWPNLIGNVYYPQGPSLGSPR